MRLGDGERMELNPPHKLIANFWRQLGKRRFRAQKPLEVGCAQGAQAPRLELQLRPQPIHNGQIVNADLAHVAALLANWPYV